MAPGESWSSWWDRVVTPFVPPFLRITSETFEGLPTFEQFKSFFGEVVDVKSVLCGTVWLGLWFTSLQYEMHKLFFIFSAFILIWRNLSSSSDPNTLSAYSVFNQGVQRIPGTFTAEQFENQLRHRQDDDTQENNNDALHQQEELQNRRDEEEYLAEQEQRDIDRAIMLSMQEEEKSNGQNVDRRKNKKAKRSSKKK